MYNCRIRCELMSSHMVGLPCCSTEALQHLVAGSTGLTVAVAAPQLSETLIIAPEPPEMSLYSSKVNYLRRTFPLWTYARNSLSVLILGSRTARFRLRNRCHSNFHGWVYQLHIHFIQLVIHPRQRRIHYGVHYRSSRSLRNQLCIHPGKPRKPY